MPDIDISPLREGFSTDMARWRLEDRGDQVEVSPRFAIGYLLGVWGVGVLMYGAALVLFPRVGDVPAPLWYGWFVGIPIFIVGAHVLAYLDYRWGVRFLIDRTKSTFTLTRLQKTWPLADIVGWQIVNYVRGPDRDEDYRSQLILVVWQGPECARFLLFTGSGRRAAERARDFVEQIAAILPLRLVSYVEDGVEKVNVTHSR